MKLKDLLKLNYLSEPTLYLMNSAGFESRLVDDDSSDMFRPQYGDKEYTTEELEEMEVIGITGRNYCKLNIILKGW